MVVGLRAALRQDPDVVVLGDLPDPETIDTAIKAAETGHLVIATMPTADVVTSIDRTHHQRNLSRGSSGQYDHQPSQLALLSGHYGGHRTQPAGVHRTSDQLPPQQRGGRRPAAGHGQNG